jgi:serine/threonine-protein kinase
MQLKTFNGRYELQQKIGEGGMARVYRAQDLRLERPVAVKVLHPHYATDPGFLRRFLNEAQAAARLRHPAIVDVYDIGQDGDDQYIVMELILGSDLKSLILRNGSLSIEQSVQIAEVVAQALDVAHRAGLIHRDVKPQNIMISDDGQVKITDFGIAKSIVSTSVTETGVVFGTADYLSPEQARGESATPRSDVYALGVTLYEMLTGRLPFTGENAIAVAMQHLNAPPPALRSYNPRIPARLEELVLQALSKDPAQRPQTGRDFAQLLRGYRSVGEQDTLASPAMRPTPRPVQPNGGTSVSRPLPINTPPRQVPPPRPRTELTPPSNKGAGFGGFLLGLLLLAGVLGLVYLGVSGAFAGLINFGSDGPRPTRVLPQPSEQPTSDQPTEVVEIQMPNLIGLTKEQAIRLLTEQKLSFTETEPRNDSIVPIDQVVDQFPRPNERIASSVPVTFTISLGPPPATPTPEILSVPDVVGLREAVARQQLEARGYIIQLIEEPSQVLSAGFVTRTNPAPPARLLPGDTVVMYVSVGNKVLMPDVFKLPLAEAERRILAAGLRIEFVDFQGPDQIPDFDNIPPNTVVSSQPRGNTWVDPGTGVVLGVRRE